MRATVLQPVGLSTRLTTGIRVSPMALGMLAMAGVAVLIRLPTLGNPLVEAHAFRQTQTAFTALMYYRDGIDLLRTPLPTIGPPGQLPFELPLFQAVAAVVMGLGVPLEIALRGTDLAFFLVSAGAIVFLLAQYGLTAWAPVVLAAYLFSPFSLEWSRASTIEYAAIAAAVGAVGCSRRAETTGHARWWLLGLALGTVAGLIKVTSAIVWLLPAIVAGRKRWIPVTVYMAAFATGFVWTSYADAIKASGPLTKFMTSVALFDYNFGNIADRLNPVIWGELIWNLTSLGILGLIGLVFVRRLPNDDRRRLWILCGGVIVVALLAFPTLYVRHIYYAAAISPAIAILIGASVAAALGSRSTRYVATVGLVLVLATYVISIPAWTVAFRPADPDHELVSAAQIQEATQPSDRVLIVGRDYSPAILMYADRQGIALPLAASISDVPRQLIDQYRIFDCGVDRLGDCVEIDKQGRRL